MKARYYTAVGIPLRDIAATLSVERLMDLFSLLALTFLICGQLPNYRGLVCAAGLAIAIGTALLVLLPSETMVRSYGLLPKNSATL